MGSEEWQTYCPNCQRITLGRKDTPNHLLHFLITILTCGLWVLVWGFLAIHANSQAYLCSVCGTSGQNA